jgi:hypothetical protein
VQFIRCASAHAFVFVNIIKIGMLIELSVVFEHKKSTITFKEVPVAKS